MAKQIMNGRAVMDSDERVSAGENKIPESIRQVRPKRELPASAKKRKPAFVVCDHAHFVGLGFWGSGAKPSAIRLSKQVTVDECEALFESPQGQRQKFRYTACTDKIRRWLPRSRHIGQACIRNLRCPTIVCSQWSL